MGSLGRDRVEANMSSAMPVTGRLGKPEHHSIAECTVFRNQSLATLASQPLFTSHFAKDDAVPTDRKRVCQICLGLEGPQWKIPKRRSKMLPTRKDNNCNCDVSKGTKALQSLEESIPRFRALLGRCTPLKGAHHCTDGNFTPEAAESPIRANGRVALSIPPIRRRPLHTS